MASDPLEGGPADWWSEYAGDVSRLHFPVTETVRLTLEFPTDHQLRPEARTVRTVQQATEQLAGALAVLAVKDRHYGGAWREQGWRGNLARLMSKSARLRRMLWRAEVLNDTSEPVQDTLQDMINLCVFMLLNRQTDNEWGPEAHNGE